MHMFVRPPTTGTIFWLFSFFIPSKMCLPPPSKDNQLKGDTRTRHYWSGAGTSLCPLLSPICPTILHGSLIHTSISLGSCHTCLEHLLHIPTNRRHCVYEYLPCTFSELVEKKKHWLNGSKPSASMWYTFPFSATGWVYFYVVQMYDIFVLLLWPSFLYFHEMC